MRSIIGNKLANLQNKTQYVGFFTRTYKTKHTTDGSLLLRDRIKVNISIFFKNICLDLNLSSVINRRGSWNKNALGEKKLISGGGTSIRHSRVFW